MGGATDGGHTSSNLAQKDAPEVRRCKAVGWLKAPRPRGSTQRLKPLNEDSQVSSAGFNWELAPPLRRGHGGVLVDVRRGAAPGARPGEVHRRKVGRGGRDVQPALIGRHYIN